MSHAATEDENDLAEAAMSTTRRTFIKDAVALSSASLVASQSILGTAHAQARDYRRIAVEEIFCPPEVITASKRVIQENPDLEPGFLDLIFGRTELAANAVRRMDPTRLAIVWRVTGSWIRCLNTAGV